MIRAPIIAALTLFAATSALPPGAAGSAEDVPVRTYRPVEQIEWSYRDDDAAGSRIQLRFSHHRMTTSFDSDEAASIMGELATATLGKPGAPLIFSLAREPGSLACTGRVDRAGAASGQCRFDPDVRFTAGMARGGLAPDDSDQVLALALVDAHIASVDGLAEQGYRFGDADDLVAVAALEVTPAYARELRNAGLKIDTLDDLVAARALKVDATWLNEMAQAGYPGLDAQRAIEMRALGVTPDYARKMARVLTVVGEIE